MRQKKMLIIDARVVVEDQNHGIARHTYELIDNLMKMDCDLDIVLLVNKNSPYFKKQLPRYFSLYLMKTNWLSIFSQLEIPFILKKLKPDLFHSPSFMVPLIGKLALVTTIHDLNHVRLAQNYSIVHRIYYNIFLKRKLQTAKCILTVSEFSKSEIVNFFKVPEAKVRVIYNGIGENFKNLSFSPEEENKKAQFLSNYDLPSDYILSVGNRKLHKNLLSLVEAYCKGDFKIPLVLLTAFDENILKIAELYKKKHLIYFCRYVSDKDIRYLYSCAKVFAYPSIYEGFGLPPLEAIACGIPVVVSQCASLPEIMGNAAIYVNPTQVESIVTGMELALNDTELQNKCKQVGLTLINRYSWKKMATETLALYHALLKGQEK